ncbi:hypothetical protein M5689_020380 [Euphorbia peplus]|nr:hypothetical protein M5689_020380 [Euphorbia peplus]
MIIGPLLFTLYLKFKVQSFDACRKVDLTWPKQDQKGDKPSAHDHLALLPRRGDMYQVFVETPTHKTISFEVEKT